MKKIGASSRRVSIVVIAYNVERYVADALTSVVFQLRPEDEIIFVDDGSTDQTLAVAAEVLKGAPNAHVIAQANGGPGAARNNGLRQAKGDYVLFLDGDDWIGADALEALHAAADGADMVLSNRRRFWESTGKYTTKDMFHVRKGGAAADLPEIMQIKAIHGKLFRRKFLIENDIFFPEGMSSEDYVFSYLTYAKAERIELLPKITYYYRKRAEALANPSLTQGRLTHFNLTSRFRQIELTQEIVREQGMKARFPTVAFDRHDYDSRLMRHLEKVPVAPPEQRREALSLVRLFLAKHRTAALQAARRKVRPIYEAILDGREDDAVAAIRAYAADKAAAKAPSAPVAAPTPIGAQPLI